MRLITDLQTFGSVDCSERSKHAQHSEYFDDANRLVASTQTTPRIFIARRRASAWVLATGIKDGKYESMLILYFTACILLLDNFALFFLHYIWLSYLNLFMF